MPANARYVKDVTIPDNTPMDMGAAFTKTWIVQNNGDVAWGPGFHFVHVDGEPMTAQTKIPLPAAAPGQQVEISLNLTAAMKLGKQFSDWRFQDSNGKFFGEIIYLIIQGKQPAAAAKSSSYFVADLTIPDGSPIQPGTAFTKTWRAKNNGNTTWGVGYGLVFVDGTPMGAAPIPVPNTPPGHEVDLSVNLKSPATPGSYFGDFRLRDPAGQLFGAKFWLQITVPAPMAAPTPMTPVGSAPTTGAAPAPGVVAAPIAAPAPVIATPAKAPHFSQRDPRWSNIPLANMGGAPTIGRWGCMMTCLTMTANSYGYSITPDQFNLLMVQRGGFVNGYFTSWSALSAVYPDIVFVSKMDIGGGNIVGRIDEFLQAARPVPVMVDTTPQTAYSDVDQHWVLVLGRNGEDYWVNDPIDLSGTPVSLLGRYGRPGGGLTDAVRSALFYRR